MLDTVYSLGLAKKPVARAEDAATAKIINRLDRISFIHERSKAQAKFEVNKEIAQALKEALMFGTNIESDENQRGME